jgi:nitrite reductase/ring-hydroxylating ferredoxin subunit/uncharacterized membrane protein
MELQAVRLGLAAGAEWVARNAAFDAPARAVQERVGNVLDGMGDGGRSLADLLHGRWLGHPAHPMLTDIPIGFMTGGALCDLLDAVGMHRFRPAADAAVLGTLVSGPLAAAAGITDYRYAEGRARRIGIVHGGLNSLALVLNAISLCQRLRGRRGSARVTAFAGMLAASAGGHLGGALVFNEGMGASHAPMPERTGKETRTTLKTADLEADHPQRLDDHEPPLAVIRHGRWFDAFDDRCAHMGGPLSEGRVVDDCIECPWHPSRFALRDGRVVQGPSVYDQPHYDAEDENGALVIRE